MFRFGKKIVDKAAWAAAVFEQPVKNPEKLTEKELHAMTDMMLYQHARIIMESVEIIRNTRNADTRLGRIDLCKKHYAQMKLLEPFSDEKQLSLINDCEQALARIGL